MSDASEPCVFCAIASGSLPASIVYEDARTIAFMDLRQFNAGHVLVIPRAHLNDIRDADDATAAAVMITVARIARAVDKVFPNDGLSLWHSAGEGANQEVPHLHVHVHPRHFGDDVLDVYPSPPALPDRDTLNTWGARVRAMLDSQAPSAPTP